MNFLEDAEDDETPIAKYYAQPSWAWIIVLMVVVGAVLGFLGYKPQLEDILCLGGLRGCGWGADDD
jgi:hypothetical protein